MMKAAQWLIILAVVLLVPSVSAASCPKYTHFLTPNFNFANNNMVFNSLDMDVKQNGVQDKVATRPGEDINVILSWMWGKTCPDCVVNINVYGTWQEDEITKIYSGVKGGAPTNSNYPISFKAPDTEGEYKLRVLFSYDKESASDFEASNLCSSGQCGEVGECHVLIAEGSINVTRPNINGSWLPLIEITSPKSTSPDGIAELGLGLTVTIDAGADMQVDNFTVEIDGEELSDFVPYTWNTVNETGGIHTLTVSAIGPRGNVVSDEMKIRLVNRSLIFGNAPSIIWSTELPGKVTGSDISGDGRIAIGLDTGKIYLLDETGVIIYEYKAPLGINSVSISSNGEHVVFGSGNTLYHLSDNGSLSWSYQTAGDIKSVSVSSNGKHIIFGAGNTLYYLSGNGSLSWSYQGSGNIKSVSISSNGKHVVFGAGNTLYYLSDNGSLSWSYQGSGNIKRVSISSNGKHAVVGFENQVVYLNESGGPVWNYTQKHKQIVGLKMISDGVIGASGNTVFFLSKKGLLNWRDLSKGITSISSAPDGKYTAVVKDRKIVLYGSEKASPKIALPGSNYTVFGFVLIVLVALLCLLYYRKSKKKTTGRPKQIPPKPAVHIGRVDDKSAPKSAAERLVKADIKEEPTTATISRDVVTRGFVEIKAVVRVINAKTGDPISGVTVTINDIKNKTDKSGTATVTGILPGKQEIKVKREYYESESLFQNIKGGENHFEVRLRPSLYLDELQEKRLQDARRLLLDSFNKVSNFDACLPNYIRGVGENIIKFTEKISYSPEFFTTAAIEYSSIMDTLIETVEEVCFDISGIITDWRNIDLYKASIKLPKGDCDAEHIKIDPNMTELINEPAHFVEMNLSSVESKVSLVDRTITDRMNELTVMPVSGLWGISRGLIAGDLKGRKRAFGVVIADIIGDYVEDMLENPTIVDRLKFSFM